MVLNEYDLDCRDLQIQHSETALKFLSGDKTSMSSSSSACPGSGHRDRRKQG